MEFVSHGKSGCKIKIINKGFDFYLHKTSKTIEENPRHVKRGKKQIDFYNKNQFVNIKTPQITKLHEGGNNTLSYMEMKYIAGKDSLTFLREADIESVNIFINNLLNYLDTGFNKAINNSANQILWPYSGKYNKVESTESIRGKANQINNLQFPLKNEIMDKLYDLPTNMLLQGDCHGDFTLTNMIHTKSNTFVFDFLDMFVDSPIFDLISLRQDTYHLWSCFIYDDYNCRVVELLKYIDIQLQEKYKTIIDDKWYNYLSLMNYARMYRMYEPNSKSKELTFINNCISKYL